MKKFTLIGAAVLLCLLLAACSRFVPAEYTQLNVHSDTQKAQEDPDALTAENFSGLKRAIRSFVSNHVEHGVIRVYNYSGNVEQDLNSAAYQIAREDPLGAYAVDYMTHDCSLIVSFYEIHIDITFRRSIQEITGIEYVGSDTEAKKLICGAMDGYESSLTFYATYYNDQDYTQIADDYYEANPGKIMVMPEIQTNVYPDSGVSRIVELTFTYPAPAATLRDMQQAVTDSLRAASVYVRYREKESDKAELLYTYLMERFTYKVQESKTPVYSLLCEGTATSESMAKSWQLLCDQVGIDCVTVAGSYKGESYWWNIVTLDGTPRHVDILADILSGGSLRTRGDSEMTDYYWDTEKYPACPTPEVQTAPAETPAEPADTGTQTDAGAGTGADTGTTEPETPAEPAPTEPETQPADNLKI